MADFDPLLVERANDFPEFGSHKQLSPINLRKGSDITHYRDSSPTAHMPRSLARLPLKTERLLEGQISLLSPIHNRSRTRKVTFQSDEQDSPLSGKAPFEFEKSVATQCYVCDKLFDTVRGIIQFQCRGCGNSICGECSATNGKTQRTCDVCKERKIEEEAEKKRKTLLAQKTEMLKRKRFLMDETESKLQQIAETMAILEQKVKSQMEDQERSEFCYEQDYEKIDAIYQKRLELNNRLKKNIARENEELNLRKKAIEELLERINHNSFEIKAQNTSLNYKLEEYNHLAGNSPRPDKGRALTIPTEILQDNELRHSAESFKSEHERDSKHLFEEHTKLFRNTFSVPLSQENLVKEEDRLPGEVMKYSGRFSAVLNEKHQNMKKSPIPAASNGQQGKTKKKEIEKPSVMQSTQQNFCGSGGGDCSIF